MEHFRSWTEMGEHMTNLSARICTGANDHIRGSLLLYITLIVTNARDVSTTRDVDIIRHEGIDNKFLERVAI